MPHRDTPGHVDRRRPTGRLLTALVLAWSASLASLRAADSAIPPAWQWFEGTWQVTYMDAVLGPVSGLAVLGDSRPQAGGAPRRVRLMTVHPRTQQVYLTDGRAEIVGANLVATVDHHGPAGGIEAAGLAGDTQALPIPSGAAVSATLDGETVPAQVVHLDPPGVLTLTFPTPAGDGPIEEITGTWSYPLRDRAVMSRGRAGDHSAASGTVTGRETWRRVPAVLWFAGPRHQPHPVDLAAARQHEQTLGLGPGTLATDPALTPVAELRARFGADITGSLWLTLTGAELLVEPRRARTVTSTAPGIVVTGRIRVHPLDPTQLDCEVALRPDFDARPKPIRLNDVPVDWFPDSPPAPVAGVRFVRRAQPFEPVTALHHGDVVQVEVAFAVAPSAPRQQILARPAGASPAAVTLLRTTESPGLFRSQRLLVVNAQSGTPPRADPAALGSGADSAADREPPLVLKLAPGAGVEIGVWGTPTLATTAGVDTIIRLGPSSAPPPTASTPEFLVLAKAPLIESEPRSAWADALRRARECRRTGRSETEFTNYVLTNLVVRGKSVAQNLPVSVEEHAAAILLRDELVAALDAFAAKLQAAVPVDSSAPPDEVRRQHRLWQTALRLEAEELIAGASRGEHHPLFAMRVTGQDGTPDWGTLGGALYLWEYQRRRLQAAGEWDAFVGYATRAIAEAKGALLSYTSESLRRARAPADCDVRELLRVTGVGLDELVARVIPRLLRPARGDEPSFPRWVPDREARTHVRSLYVLADAVAAQEDYAALSREMALLVLSAPVALSSYGAATAFKTASHAGSIRAAWAAHRWQQVNMVAGLGLEAADIYSLFRDYGSWERAYRDRVFGLGLAGVAGIERYQRAIEAEFEKRMQLLTGMSMRVLALTAFGGARAWIDEAFAQFPRHRAENPFRVLEGVVLEHVRTKGVASLPPAGQRVFAASVAAARQRALNVGVEGLTPAEREILRYAGAAPSAPAPGIVHAPATPLAANRDDALQSADPGTRLEILDAGSGSVGSPPPAPGSAPTRFDTAARERVSAYFQDELQFPPELMPQRIEFWEKAGLDADAVIAGHHFLHNRSNAHLPLPEENFRGALDRFLTRTDQLTPARRKQVVEAYLAGGLAPLPPRVAGEPGPGGSGAARPPIESVPPAGAAAPPASLGPLPPTVIGHPGPGVRMDHIAAAQRVADAIDAPVVILGSRQSGFRISNGAPFAPNADLDLGVIGDGRALIRLLKVVDPEARGTPGHIEVPDVIHGPMLRSDTEGPVLAAGHLIIRPRPNPPPAGPPVLAHLPPPPPPPAPLPRLTKPGPDTNQLPDAKVPVSDPRFASPPRAGATVTLRDGRSLRIGDRTLNRRGLMADLRDLFDANGRRVDELLVKLYGLRPNPDDPSVPSLTLAAARRTVINNVHGYQTLQRLNAGKRFDDQVELARIVAFDADSNLPSLVTDRVGGPHRPAGVAREYVGTDDPFVLQRAPDGTVIVRHNQSALRSEAQDAILSLWKKLIAGRVLAEDLHPNNLALRVREAPPGRERWSAVIIDHDRIVHWDEVGVGNPRALEIEVRVQDLNQAPEELGVFSLGPDTMPDNPRVFMLKMLEFKRYIYFNRQTGKFESAYLDIERVLDAFPDLYQHVTWRRTGHVPRPVIPASQGVVHWAPTRTASKWGIAA